MAKHGIDEGSLNAEVFVQAHEWFIVLDNLIQSAQTRRVLLFREINGPRSLGRSSAVARQNAAAHPSVDIRRHSVGTRKFGRRNFATRREFKPQPLNSRKKLS
ncbi:hypothetical protein [Bradyrhizobium sp. S69]|uniref:hypothetical protein n=1 Tax=Bradyrhizobium sp. S69 TaxID=1641856 RepID=UPI00131BC1AA|nr:hypothetical protein [Bradyrhizobium sp. S69]